VTLLLGGDIFDFLTVTEVPSREEAQRQGIVVTSALKRVGLSSTSRHLNWKLERIVEGHPAFFEALGRMLADGNRLVIMAGNNVDMVIATIASDR
jgi:UDP-2,3-diacylglucosamine pyrophosphatase LpxH